MSSHSIHQPRMTTAETHRQILGERNNVVIPKIYIDFVKGDYVSAVVLKEIVWGSGDYSQTAERDGWMYNSEKDWQDHHFLSRKQVNRSIAHINACADGDMIDKRVSKRTTSSGDVLNENVTYYRLNTDVYDSIFRDGPSGRFGNVPNGSSGNSPSGKSLTIYTGTNTGTGTAGEKPTDDGATEAKPTSVNDLFETFWQAYPKSVKGRSLKRDSLAAFKVAIKKTDIQTLLNAIEWWKRTDKWRQNGGEYIDGAQKWLRKEMWVDAEEQPAPQEGGSYQQLDQFGIPAHLYGTERITYAQDKWREENPEDAQRWIEANPEEAKNRGWT